MSHPSEEKFAAACVGQRVNGGSRIPLATPRCGLQVIELRSGDVVHELTVEGVAAALYHVVALPDVTRPVAFGFQSNKVEHVLSVRS